MRNLNKYTLKISAVFTLVFSVLGAFAQDAAKAAAPPTPPGSGFVVDINTVLAIVAILLLVVVAVLGITLKSSMELYKHKVDQEKDQKKDSNLAKVITMIVGFIFFFRFFRQRTSSRCCKRCRIWEQQFITLSPDLYYFHGIGGHFCDHQVDQIFHRN